MSRLRRMFLVGVITAALTIGIATPAALAQGRPFENAEEAIVFLCDTADQGVESSGRGQAESDKDPCPAA